jgi:hypothetical protein
MKLTRTLVLGASAVAFAFTGILTPAVRADEKKHGDHAAVAVPATAEGILAEIHKRHEAITALVKAKTLKPIHEEAEPIMALAKALPGKVDADKKARVQSAANNTAKAADGLHDASDTGDQAKTEAELKKLDFAVGQLDKAAK